MKLNNYLKLPVIFVFLNSTISYAVERNDGCNELRKSMIGKNLEVYGPSFDSEGEIAKKGSLKLFDLSLAPMSYQEKRKFLEQRVIFNLIDDLEAVQEDPKLIKANHKINKSLAARLLEFDKAYKKVDHFILQQDPSEEVETSLENVEKELVGAAEKVPGVTLEMLMNTRIALHVPMSRVEVLEKVFNITSKEGIYKFYEYENPTYNSITNLLIENFYNLDVEQIKKLSALTVTAINNLELYKAVTHIPSEFAPYDFNDLWYHGGFLRVGKVYTFMSKGIEIQSSQSSYTSNRGEQKVESTSDSFSVNFSDEFLQDKFSDSKEFSQCMLTKVDRESGNNGNGFLFPSQNDFWFRSKGSKDNELIFSAVEFHGDEDEEDQFRIVIKN